MPQLVPTIGLEVHCQLKTQTKMFCACPITHAAPPNTAVCPVCLGHPGALPVVNDQAVRLAVCAGTALGCSIQDGSLFARKHYFYPDLPKGYQISQFDQPICQGGALHCELDGARVRFELERIHMEEDAGKLTHDGERSLVDWNRGGTPLIEIVGRPDIPSSAAAESWMRMLHRVLTAAGVTHGDLEKGHFRCDADVSHAPEGGPLGTRVELKNINSFRFLSKAIDSEIERQREVIASGGRVVQSTRSWTGSGTEALRSKEDAADYRYFPDPDLGPVPIMADDLAFAEGVLEGVPLDLFLLDSDRAEVDRFKAAYGLPDGDVDALLSAPEQRRFFEEAVTAGGVAKPMANWVRGPWARWINDHAGEAPRVRPDQVVDLERRIEDGQLTRDVARAAFEVLCDSGADLSTLIEERGWAKMDDGGAILDAVQALIADHSAEAERYRAGEKKLLGFFIGQVMRRFEGRADASDVRSALVKALDDPTMGD